jgi:hypothetical protein
VIKYSGKNKFIFKEKFCHFTRITAAGSELVKRAGFETSVKNVDPNTPIDL